MRRWVFALVVAAVCQPVRADDFCKKVSDSAMVVMKARQNGIPMADLMSATAGKPHTPITHGLIHRAYDIAVRRTAEDRQREITEFANGEYKNCIATELETR